MNATCARDIAAIAVSELHPLLERCLSPGLADVLLRSGLKHARERLHEFCRLYEDGDAAEVYEEWYLPLFDALAYTADALALPTIRRDRISMALAALDGLRSKSKSA